jgi:hypothetical protein
VQFPGGLAARAESSGVTNTVSLLLNSASQPGQRCQSRGWQYQLAKRMEQPSWSLANDITASDQGHEGLHTDQNWQPWAVAISRRLGACLVHIPTPSIAG